MTEKKRETIPPTTVDPDAIRIRSIALDIVRGVAISSMPPEAQAHAREMLAVYLDKYPDAKRHQGRRR